MDESADARRILIAVAQSDWRRPVGWPHSTWMATLKNDLSLHNLTYEDAIEMALDKPLWGLLTTSGATHWWCMPNNDDDVMIVRPIHHQIRAHCFSKALNDTDSWAPQHYQLLMVGSVTGWGQRQLRSPVSGGSNTVMGSHEELHRPLAFFLTFLSKRQVTAVSHNWQNCNKIRNFYWFCLCKNLSR